MVLFWETISQLVLLLLLKMVFLLEGNRATLRGLNINGLRRRMENRSDIDEIKKAYKKLFESNLSMQDVAKELVETSENKYVLMLAKFVTSTTRGIPVQGKNNK
ncbi:MAG: hypothetical protein HY307_00055 [Arcobacter sp.]|nr:hypothetical protein [Arcobacter sp.]